MAKCPFVPFSSLSFFPLCFDIFISLRNTHYTNKTVIVIGTTIPVVASKISLRPTHRYDFYDSFFPTRAHDLNRLYFVRQSFSLDPNLSVTISGKSTVFVLKLYSDVMNVLRPTKLCYLEIF